MIKPDNSGGACGHDRLKLKAGSNYQPQSIKHICVPQIFLLRSDLVVNPRPGFLSFSSWLSRPNFRRRGRVQSIMHVPHCTG